MFEDWVQYLGGVVLASSGACRTSEWKVHLFEEGLRVPSRTTNQFGREIGGHPIPPGLVLGLRDTVKSI